MSETFNWCQDKTRLATWDKHVFCIDYYGTKWWYLNGIRHREDGPVIEYANGDKWWYLNGKYYSESDYWKELGK